MKTKSKFKIGDAVKLKTNLGMKLEVLRIKDMGSYHHRLLTVNDRKCRKEFRIQTAGSLRHFPSVKGTCQRAECAGCIAVTVKPCGRKPAGQAADAF